MASISIFRDTSLIEAQSQIVCLDGREIGYISRGSELHCDAQPGKHTLEIRCSLFKRRLADPITFHIESEKNLHFQIRCTKSVGSKFLDAIMPLRMLFGNNMKQNFMPFVIERIQ